MPIRGIRNINDLIAWSRIVVASTSSIEVRVSSLETLIVTPATSVSLGLVKKAKAVTTIVASISTTADVNIPAVINSLVSTVNFLITNVKNASQME